MAKSRFYDATEEDARSWVADHATRSEAADTASQAVATALQQAAWDTNPSDGINATPATVAMEAATASTIHTIQIAVTGKIGTVETTTPVVVTYASSSTGKATVSDTGLITAVAAGTATITVTAVHDTSATDTVVATVS